MTNDTDRLASEARVAWLLTQLGSTLSMVQPESEKPVVELLAGFIEHCGAGSPRLDPFGDIREDARFWADVASPPELEAYVAAGLRRIERTQFARSACKRILVSMWEALPTDDKRAFLARADPDGVFRRVKP